jgi:hypothetical protein
MFLLNGKKIQDRGFEAGEYRYPPGWIALASPEERAAIGITEVPDPIRPDSRYFDAVENEDGSLTVTPKPAEKVIAYLQSLVQNHLDAAAQAKRYDNIRSAALRAAYPGPFHDEGVAFATWMDACWAHCFEALAAVQAGTRSMPTADELIAELPALI